MRGLPRPLPLVSCEAVKKANYIIAGILVLGSALIPACSSSSSGGGSNCQSVCQAGSNAASQQGCSADVEGCVSECQDTQQQATSAGCSSQFNAAASCLTSSGSDAWDCDEPNDDSDAPCYSQLAALNACLQGGTSNPPAGTWYCASSYYGTGDGCDCGCGAVDPDCESGGCTTGGCSAADCDFCYDSSGSSIGCSN